jgi:hypothetical protein
MTRTAAAAASTNSNLPISPSLSKTTNVEAVAPTNSLNSESDNFNSGGIKISSGTVFSLSDRANKAYPSDDHCRALLLFLNGQIPSCDWLNLA